MELTRAKVRRLLKERHWHVGVQMAHRIKQPRMDEQLIPRLTLRDPGLRPSF